MLAILKKLTPPKVKRNVKRMISGYRKVKRRVKGMIPNYPRLYCPLCGKSETEFEPFGFVRRRNACCPNCLSLERHRMVWLFFHRQTDLFDGKPKKMLHVAPEPQMRRLLEAVPQLDYLTADLNNPAVHVRMNITDIQFPDNIFDVIYCSHVLEHVPADRQAMREFYRVLKPNGWCVLLVPITAESTFEDPTVVDPAERERLFGQHDHVRCYGPDFVDRIREAGFKVRMFTPVEVIHEDDPGRYAIPTTEWPIFYAE